MFLNIHNNSRDINLNIKDIKKQKQRYPCLGKNAVYNNIKIKL